MNPNITLADVANAIDTLKASGQKPTVTNIRAALGNRGSASTILKFKRQVEQGTLPAVDDSAPGLENFRQLWALAIASGRSERDAEFVELNETIEALTNDNERLEAECTGIRTRVADLERQRDQLITDLAKAQQDVAAAQAAGQQHAASAADALTRLANMQDAYNIDRETMQKVAAEGKEFLLKQLNEAKESAHEHLLRNAGLKAELTAAKAEAVHYGALANAADQRASKALEQAQALSLAYAQASTRHATNAQSSTPAATTADATPSLPFPTTDTVPAAKPPQTPARANKKPSRSK